MTDQEVVDRKALEKLAKRADSGDEWEAVETDEPTPNDPTLLNRVLVRKLDAVLAAQAVTARVLLKHDDWLSKVGKVWDVAKKAWPAGLLIAARPELFPAWLRELVSVLVGGGQ